jgi:predicted RNA-binding Zn ribbon-like protein
MMRVIRLVIAAFLVSLAPGTSWAQDGEIVVRGTAAKAEIERILIADNLNPETMSTRDIADTIAGIERGRAPKDFWTAYQAHVRAWQRLAAAEEEAQRTVNDPGAFRDVAVKLVAAEQQIESTFDEVERIALSYGAKMPIPPSELERIA